MRKALNTAYLVLSRQIRQNEISYDSDVHFRLVTLTPKPVVITSLLSQDKYYLMSNIHLSYFCV